jgi:hypothetical protein
VKKDTEIEYWKNCATAHAAKTRHYESIMVSPDSMMRAIPGGDVCIDIAPTHLTKILDEILEWRTVVNELETEPTPKGLVELSNRIFDRQTEMTAEIIDLRDRLRSLAKLAATLFHEGVIEACSFDGGDIQDHMSALGLVDCRLAEPGTLDAEEWGEDTELHYLAQWVVDAANESKP